MSTSSRRTDKQFHIGCQFHPISHTAIIITLSHFPKQLRFPVQSIGTKAYFLKGKKPAFYNSKKYFKKAVPWSVSVRYTVRLLKTFFLRCSSWCKEISYPASPKKACVSRIGITSSGKQNKCKEKSYLKRCKAKEKSRRKLWRRRKI